MTLILAAGMTADIVESGRTSPTVPRSGRGSPVEPLRPRQRSVTFAFDDDLDFNAADAGQPKPASSSKNRKRVVTPATRPAGGPRTRSQSAPHPPRSKETGSPPPASVTMMGQTSIRDEPVQRGADDPSPPLPLSPARRLSQHRSDSAAEEGDAKRRRSTSAGSGRAIALGADTSDTEEDEPGHGQRKARQNSRQKRASLLEDRPNDDWTENYQ